MNNNGKSLENWIWDAACSIRGAKDAAKYKEFILPLIFTKRLCDVFDDELDRIAKEVGSRASSAFVCAWLLSARCVTSGRHAPLRATCTSTRDCLRLTASWATT